MPPAVQLSFQLRTSSNVRTVHLLGSWDNYQRQLPLAAISDGKPGSWKGTFRFQGSQALQLGSRYWYYYIIDGYHVSHDPAKDSVTEKTTGRKLNILDVPGMTSKTTATTTTTKPTMKTSLSVQTKNLPSVRTRRESADMAYGRSLSPTKIQCPRPQKPYASRGLREADYESSPVEDLEERFASVRLSDHRMQYYASSPSQLSDVSSASGGTFSSPNSASPSSCSSAPPACKCERYGLTKEGRRVKLDCGGRRCNYADSSSSECASSDSDGDSGEDERMRIRMKTRMTTTKTRPSGEIRRVTATAQRRTIRR